jgi:nitrogen-specific signal transduction histidine kinase
MPSKKQQTTQERVHELSHEAKNVVCNILGGAEIIEMEFNDSNSENSNNEVIKEMLSHIKTSASQLITVIENLVALVNN